MVSGRIFRADKIVIVMEHSKLQLNRCASSRTGSDAKIPAIGASVQHSFVMDTRIVSGVRMN